MYITYCHRCDRALSSEDTPRCRQCDWLRCDCGACGCGYQVAAAQAALAGVARVWTPVTRAPAAGFGWRHSSGPWVVAAAGGLAIVAIIAGNSLIASNRAEPAAEPLPIEVSALAPSDSGAFPSVVLDPASAEAALASTATEPGTDPAAREGAAEAAASAAASAAVAPAVAAPVRPAVVPTFLPTPAPGARPAAVPTKPVDPAMARVAIGPVPPVFGSSSSPVSPPVGMPAVLYVANTDGVGVFLRSHPRDGNDTRLIAWNEGTPMTPLEMRAIDAPGGQQTWVRVRDPNGQSGWIKQAFLSQSRT